MDLTLNYLQSLIRHKAKTTNQPTNQNVSFFPFFLPVSPFLSVSLCVSLSIYMICALPSDALIDENLRRRACPLCRKKNIYVCVSVYIYIYMYIYMCVCVFPFLSVCVYNLCFTQCGLEFTYDFFFL